MILASNYDLKLKHLTGKMSVHRGSVNFLFSPSNSLVFILPSIGSELDKKEPKEKGKNEVRSAEFEIRKNQKKKEKRGRWVSN